MGDRRPFSFRFWQSASSPNSRTPAPRTTTTRPAPQTSAARPATTTSAAMPPPPTDGTQTSGQSNTTTPSTAVTAKPTIPASMTPPAAVMETPATKSTATTTPTPPAPTLTTQPEPKTQMAEQLPPPSDLQNAGQTTTTTARPTNGHQKKSPSQSRSPPQPSSPSTPSSPSRTTPSTPQRTPQLRSSSRLTTLSPKQTSSRSTNAQSTLPSKESTQDISNSDKPPTFASNENELKPETSQQNPQLEADGQTVGDKKFRENQMEVMSPKLSEISATTSPVKDPKTPAQGQMFISSTINAEHNPHNESNKKPEETKEVKEVMQATNTEANTTTKKDENHLLTPKSGSEAQTTRMAEIASKPDQIQMEKKQARDTKEILPASLPDIKPSNATISKPRNSSLSSNARAQSALPSGKHVPLSKDIRDDISKLINRTNAGDPKSIDDRSLSVITLAGENRGASMQMGSNVSKTEGPIHIHRGYKTKRDESAEVTIDGVESSKGNKSEDAKGPGDQQRVSYINNNIQGINNSIVFNSSVAKRDPGVHMVITRVPNEPTETTDRRRSSEIRKAEVSITPANKLAYEPKVRRRCIIDLYLEPSDSDPENPQMP